MRYKVFMDSYEKENAIPIIQSIRQAEGQNLRFNSCYKVVRIYLGEPKSFFSDKYHFRAVVPLKQSTPVRPKVGKIFVFSRIDYAAIFLVNYAYRYRYAIYGCKSGELQPIKQCMADGMDVMANIKTFWNEVYNSNRARILPFTLTQPPQGTMVTDWIQLRKKLWPL